MNAFTKLFFVLTLLVISRLGLAADINAEKTILSNGVYAAGYADVTLQGGGESRYGLATGWQLIRGFGCAATLGYAVSNRTDAKSLLRGPEVQAMVAPEGWYVYGGLAYSPLIGYTAYKNPAENTDKYVEVSGRRMEGKIAFRVFRSAHVLFVAGSNSISLKDGVPEDAVIERDDQYFGVGMRFTQL